MKKVIIIIASVLFLISAGLALYPSLSQAINNYYARGTVREFNEQVKTLKESDRQKFFDEAQAYNEELTYAVTDAFSSRSFRSDSDYNELLSMNSEGQMGSVNIPKIECCLPIYHGSSENVLDKGAVHLPTTSLPTGGEGNHSVISAHTAYPGKEFFNRLDELEIGDVFYLEIFGRTLYYKVSDINIVLPNYTGFLNKEADKDLVTLVTCTPYSINTHRLLVTGERFFPNESTADEATVDEILIVDQEPSVPAIIIITQIVIAVLGVASVASIIVIFIVKRKKKKNET